MKKNAIIRKLAEFILFLFVFSLNNFYFVKAESYYNANDKKVISINEHGEASASVFNEADGFWAPGIKKNKSFYIQNNSTDNCTLNKISFKISLKDKNGNMIDSSSDRYKYFTNSMNAAMVYNGKTLFSGKLSDLLNTDINYNNDMTIEGRGKVKIDLTFSMNSNADSSLQNLTGIIDMKFIFTSLDGNSLIEHLTKTGSLINTSTLIILGGVFVALGVFIITRKRNHNKE